MKESVELLEKSNLLFMETIKNINKMKRSFRKIIVVIVFYLGFMNFFASAQSTNIAPLAVVTGSTCNTGACSTLNDLNLGTCGTQSMWVTTTNPPSTTPGVEWIQWDWPTAQTFDKLVIHHAETASRFMAGFTAQTWNGTAWVTTGTVSGLIMQCSNTVTFPIAVSSAKFRITAFLMSGSQLSNPNYREIEIINSKVYKTDAGIAAVDSPFVNILPGMHLVAAKITNYGKDTLKTATVNWSYDGVLQTSLPWTGSLAKNISSSSLSLGNLNFVNGSHTIKIWTSNPNSAIDSNKFNDTIKAVITVCNLLSGTFIIDKSGKGDFVSVNSAISALSYCGINGPVTFRMRPGVYTERVVIPPIPGASAINRITLDGGSADSTKIEYSTGSSGNSAVFGINGADYITIRNLTIENLNATYACGVHLGNKSEYDIIENCIINLGITSTSSSAIPIMASSTEAAPTTYGDCANYCIIRNNRLIGGYYSIRFYGLSSAPYSMGNSFINNTIESFYYYGTYFYYLKNLTFQYNKVIKPRYAYAYGVMAYYVYNSVFDANVINPGNYGLYLFYHQNVAPDSTVVSNNIITNFMNGTYQIGIYNYSSYRVHYLNNSVWSDGTYTSTTSYGCVYDYSSQNCVFKNNIFKSTGNLPCFTSSGSTFANGAIDYNNYIPSSTATVAYTGTSYATLPLWKAADLTKNLNSITLEPGFVNSKDLHLQLSSPLMLGTKVPFSNDVDGDYRCQISTTLGADEYHYPALQPIAGFVTSDSTCQNSPLNFWNIASVNDVTKNLWYVNSVPRGTKLNFSYTPTSTGVDTISLVTANCFGADTFTRTIAVVAPTKAPVTDFVAGGNRLKVGELMRLNDLSTGCPSAWEWKISPDTILDLVTGSRQPSYTLLNGTTLASQNPEMQFNFSGFYDVKLKTSNSIGTGTTEIKASYISVVPTFTMCFGSPITEEVEGFLYDNGGKAGNYTANKSCTYTIHPCASTVTLTFPKFNFSSGDYLRIYQGTNNKGLPLWNKKLYPSGMGNANQASFPSDTTVFKSLTGSIFIEFETDGSLFADGFEAFWTSTPGVFTPPSAAFSVADSNCKGSHVFFENSSTGDDNKYFWDFDNNGIFESTSENPDWIYKSNGVYNAILVVVNCVGTDSASKSVTIFTSVKRPTVDFEVSNNRPNMALETVSLVGFASTYCVDTFSWFITPNSYIIKAGTVHDNSLDVIFNDSVCYDITLISGYRGMMDSIMKPCYVRPIEYCIPNFSFFTPDIGISRVTFNDIDQVSEAGKAPYEDFTDTKTSLLEHGARYSFSVSRNTNFNYVQRKIWIDYNIDGDFNDVGEMVAYDTLSNALTWTGSVTIPNTATPGKSRLRVGVSAINQQFGSCSILNNGEYEDYSVMLSTVVTPPVITIKAATQINVPECGTYTDQGATAVDMLGNSIPVTSVGTVDPTVPATYLIKYNATDQFGNKAIEKVRTVIVVPDNIVPVFTLFGKIYDTIVVKSNYTDPMYTYSDNCSGVDTVLVNSNLNINVLGSYTITYQCFDKRANMTTDNRHIEVIDNINPVITVFDPDTIFMEVNTALNPRVLKITDNYYKTFSIVTTGTFYQNFNTGLATSIGKYTITYDVSDGSGNKASKTFWIKVGDQTSPILILNGPRIINLCRYDTFAEEGFVVEDNVDPNPKVVRAGSYFTDYLVNYANGTYEIQYIATDNSNNFSYISRLLYVSDSDACTSSIIDRKNKEFKVYPNPSSGKFSIDIDFPGSEKTIIEVFNSLGKMVYSKEFRNSKLIQLDLGHVNNGIYNVQMISNGIKRSTNVIIAH